MGEDVSLTRLYRTSVFIFAISLSVNSAGAWPQRHAVKKTRVRFLATSTLIRNSWGPNEDTYFAELLFPKQNEAVPVRLIDAYPNEAPPLSRVALTSPAGTILRVKRDQGCDLPYSRLQLRSAPGDSMAMLPVKISYQPKSDHAVAPEAILPCYRVSR